MRTLIDTRLWVLALKGPVYPADLPEHDLALRAQELIEQALGEDEVLFSGQLLAEVHSVATGRGRRVRADVVRGYLDTILSLASVRFEGTEAGHYREAVSLSTASGVHVWDFLVVLPFRGRIDRIVTMDPHFRDPALASFGAVENPFAIWKTEGER